MAPDFDPRNPNDLRTAANVGSQRQAFPGVPPGNPVKPSAITDLQHQREIIRGLTERVDQLENHLAAILPREPETAAPNVKIPVRERFYTSAGASLTCELVADGNDALMYISQRLERLIQRVEV